MCCLVIIIVSLTPDAVYWKKKKNKGGGRNFFSVFYFNKTFKLGMREMVKKSIGAEGERTQKPKSCLKSGTHQS